MQYKLLQIIVFLPLLFLAWSVSAQEDEFQVEQKVRNLTQQEFSFEDAVQAEPDDRVEFQVIVTWKGSFLTTNVLVTERLSKELLYGGNLKVNGIAIAGDLGSENINLGIFDPDQSKTVTFEATVASDAAELDLTATTIVFNAEDSKSTSATVRVGLGGIRGGGATPTDISTGALSPLAFAFLITLAFLFVASYVFFVRYYVTNRILKSPYDTGVERKLAEMTKAAKQETRGG